MPEAVAALAGEIRRHGAVPFDRFMAVALYHPRGGYYERAADPVGKRGDFFTSVSVGPLFGELLGFAFAEWLDRLPASAPAWLIEAGAHDGRLARDLLGWLRQWRPALWPRLRHGIVEPSPRRAARQRTVLAGDAELAGKTRWFASLAEAAAARPRGVLFANELLDALPLRRFVWDAARRRWRELAVTLSDDESRFVWTRRDSAPPPADEEPDAPVPWRALADRLPDGWVWEHPVEALRWWREAAQTLAAGWLMTLDYGGWESGAPALERPNGTLRAFRGHHQVPDVLADPGAQDLTADVDFAALRRVGEAAGWRTETATAQGRWLTRVAGRIARAPERFPPWDAARRRRFLTLVHPEHLGGRFQVLVQRKGVGDERA
jgi:SAM-dependent MidA family methyltransferase